MGDEGATFSGAATFTAVDFARSTITIDLRALPVEVVFADGHREPLEVPEDAAALRVEIPEGLHVAGAARR